MYYCPATNLKYWHTILTSNNKRFFCGLYKFGGKKITVNSTCQGSRNVLLYERLKIFQKLSYTFPCAEFHFLSQCYIFTCTYKNFFFCIKGNILAQNLPCLLHHCLYAVQNPGGVACTLHKIIACAQKLGPQRHDRRKRIRRVVEGWWFKGRIKEMKERKR